MTGRRRARPAIPRLLAAAFAFAAFVARLEAARGRDRLPAVHPAVAGAGRRALRGGLADGTIAPHALRTLTGSCSGFGVGAGSAVVVGYLLARLPLVERLLSPYLVAAQATPILAFAPLLALWFGPGIGAKVVICALIVFFPVAIATMVGIRAVDARLLELARSLRATRRQVVTTLEIPAALPRSSAGCASG